MFGRLAPATPEDLGRDVGLDGAGWYGTTGEDGAAALDEPDDGLVDVEVDLAGVCTEEEALWAGVFLWAVCRLCFAGVEDFAGGVLGAAAGVLVAGGVEMVVTGTEVAGVTGDATGLIGGLTVAECLPRPPVRSDSTITSRIRPSARMIQCRRRKCAGTSLVVRGRRA